MIAAHPDQGVPAARALFRKLLLAETDPPKGGGAASPVLVARVDRLLAIGALAEARALIDRAGPETPELFRRWFDVGLLLDDADEPCAALRQNPSLSPTLPARVFCLARGGDWNAAEITLTLGEEVGSIGDDQQALLARFLDPALFEEEPEPPIARAADRARLPDARGGRPAAAARARCRSAFLHMDLDEHAPMRTRAEAAERLVLSGAIAAPALFAAYRSGEPAASGGVWDRAQAVQALDAALAGGRRRRPGARRRRRGADDARPPGGAGRGVRRAAGRARPASARRRRAAGARRAAAARRRGRGGGARRGTDARAADGRRCWRSPARAQHRAAPDRPGRRPRSPASAPPRRPTAARRELAATLAAGRQGEAILGALALVAGRRRGRPAGAARGADDAAARRAGRRRPGRSRSQTLLAGPVG